MRYLTWLLRIALFVALLGFALKNNEVISLRYLFDYEWQLPLVVALFCFLVIGVLIGMLAMMGSVVRLRNELAHARSALESKHPPSSTEAHAPSPEQPA